MKFTESRLKGAYLIEIEPIEDARGFFALSWSSKEFEARGLDANLVECNISFNKPKGTVRGMHYQAAPYAQPKLVRCTMGSIHDVIIDLRPSSPTYKQWIGVELGASNRRMLYIPSGCAHGFQTLEDHTEVFYQMSGVFNAESGRGVRWNDPAFGIQWPLDLTVISPRDRDYPDFAG